MASKRHRIVLPNGEVKEANKDQADTYTGMVLDNDNTPRDISTDTLTVKAKLGAADKTSAVTITKLSPNTDGKYTVGWTATAADAVADLNIDVYVQKSGGSPNVNDKVAIAVVDSDAD